MPANRTDTTKVMIKAFWVDNRTDMKIRRYQDNRGIATKQAAVADLLAVVCSGDYDKLKRLLK